MRHTKTPVTVRLNPDLLEMVRASAAKDNRSLTNYIETALRQRISADSSSFNRSRSSEDAKNR
jgi:predicted HicB family RNase H-like nuclease